MKKLISLVLALVMIFAFSVSAFATADTKTLTVNYTGPSAGYTWSIPVSVTAVQNSAVNAGNVSVTKFIDAESKNLVITLTSTTYSFKVKNGTKTLNYTVGKTDSGTGLTAGGTVMTVASGSDLSTPRTQAIYVKLQAVGDTTAVVTGDYTDTITFTAEVVNAA